MSGVYHEVSILIHFSEETLGDGLVTIIRSSRQEELAVVVTLASDEFK